MDPLQDENYTLQEDKPKWSPTAAQQSHEETNSSIVPDEPEVQELPKELPAESKPNKIAKCCEMAKHLEGKSFLIDVDIGIPLQSQETPAITITDAAKTVDFNGKSFVSYTIVTTISGCFVESKHRYSDFESLRDLLVSTYNSVVPPIPSKHSVVDYASKPGKAMLDETIINKRKRLLQSFLLRVASDPILQNNHSFHLFLTGDTPWGAVIRSSTVLKKKNSVAILDRPLQRPDLKFESARDYTARFGGQLTYIKKIFRNIITIYSELVSISSELGATYNGWSLTEKSLSVPVEQIGEVMDGSANNLQLTHKMLQQKCGDIWSEYQSFSHIISELLAKRHKTHLEFEQASEELGRKQMIIANLEENEQQSQRLSAALVGEGQPPPIPVQRATGLVASFNSLMDNDPQNSRRNSISRTKASMEILETSREEKREALLAMNTEIQEALDRFQVQKIKDLRNALVSLSMVMHNHTSKELLLWKECKNVVVEACVEEQLNRKRELK